MFQTFRPSRCDEFLRNPTRNPDTGRPIRPGAETYNRLVRECGAPPITTNMILPPTVIPQTNQIPPVKYPRPFVPNVTMGNLQRDMHYEKT
jgi:hypothetical protein